MEPIKHGAKEHKRCLPEQFARVHWKAKLSSSGHLVQDTVFTSGVDSPIEFKIGHSHLTHCMDLAVPQMKPGDKMNVHCPAKLVYGGANVYSDFSSEVIPPNSDLTYELEVLSCLNHQSWAS